MKRTHGRVLCMSAAMVFLSGAMSARAITNMWDNGAGAGDTTWANPVNWNPNSTPTVNDQARFQTQVGAQYSTYAVTNNGAESVDSVVVNTAGNNNINWLGSGSLTVARDFSFLSVTVASNYFKPTLTVNGVFYTAPDRDWRPMLHFGDSAGFTSGNNFAGGIDNSCFNLNIGGSTAFGSNSTVRVAGSSAIGILDRHGHHVQIQGTPSFGTNMTFDLRRGGVLRFPASAAFDNVSTLRFNGGLLRLEAASGNTFPTYANGFEVKRGLLAITGNGSLGADANALVLGSQGGFGTLMGAAANSAGNYITRSVTLTGNGGFVNPWQWFNNNDINFATPITGSGMLIKAGNKTLYLRNAGSGTTSSYSGGTVVANGILSVESARTLGSGNVTIVPGGQLDLAAAANVGAGAKVLAGGNVYNRGILRMLANEAFPAIDTNSTGVIALEVNNANTLTSIGSAFLGSANNGARYSGTSLPAGPDHVYRIGGTLGLAGDGAWQQGLSLDVNGAANGTGVLTGNNDVLVAYGGGWLKDLNDFTGSLTVRRNVNYSSWGGVQCQAEFQTGGSPLGSTSGAVNLYCGHLYFYNYNNGLAITKGALNLQGQSYISGDASANYNETDVTFDSLNRTNRAQLSIMDGNLKLGQPDAGHGNKMVKVLIANGAPTPINNIVAPWLTYGFNTTSASFLTYGANGFSTQGCVSVAVPAGNFPSLINGTDVVQVTGAATLVDDPDIYALRADAAISGAANTITLRSGGLILNSASTHTMKLKFGAAGDAEGIVFCTADATLSGGLTTTAGLTKGGQYSLTLGKVDNSATLSGKITVNGGQLKLKMNAVGEDDKALGHPNNVLCLNGGAINGTLDQIKIYHTISVGDAGGYLPNYQGSYYGSIVDDVPGVPGGPLVITYPTTLRTNNTFSGAIIVQGWGLTVAEYGTLGNGPVVTRASGTIYVSGRGWTDLSRFTLAKGAADFALQFGGSGYQSGAQMWRIGSVEGDGNICWGQYYDNEPPVGSALAFGGDNTSCDYHGSIYEYQPSGRVLAIVKEGSGTWTLWGDHAWRGATTVSNGTLQVNGAIEFSSGITVKNGATLSGKGYIGSRVTVEAGGTLAGSLVFATNVTLNASVTNTVTVGGTNAVSQFSQMTLNGGTLTLAGCQLNLALNAPLAVGSSYTILNNAGGSVSGEFSQGRVVTAVYNGKTYAFSINYAGGDGNDIVLTVLPQGTVFSIR